MKIQLLSDTHEDLKRFKPSSEVDLIIHAGDFSKSLHNSIEHIINFVDICEEYNKDYVIVLGNHDYYGFVYRDEVIKTLDDLKINYLVVGKEFKFKGWTFIGDTLFSEFNLPNYDNEFLINNAKYYLSDFHYIGYNSTSLVTPQDYISEFYKQYKWINSFRNKENIFVITHFVPSVQLIHEQYEQSPLNPYFVNNLNLKGFSHWACGHSHQTIRNVIDGCNVYMNAYGYTDNINWECPEFNENYIIEI